MREILFRGKRVDNGEWVEGHYGEYNSGKENVPCISIPKETISGSLCYDVILKTVCQYTGIKDKNGKKVFEHDIVKAYDPLDELDEIFFIGVVKYFDGSFYICNTDFCSDYRWMDYDVEVIGNVFDNPELTKIT